MSHRRHAGRALAGIALLAVAAVASAGPAGAATHTINQFTIKSPNNQPGDMTIGNDGNVWFVDQATSKLAKIAKGGAITGFLALKNSHPLGVTTASDGAVWFTETAVNRVGHTTNGKQPIPQITLPTTGANAIRSPRGITAGPDGKVYVVGYTTHNVVSINVSTPHTVHLVAALPAGSGPVRITSGPDGNLWVSESASHQVARVTPGGVVTQVNLPNKAAPSRLASSPDGNIWVVEPGISKIAVITPGATPSAAQIGITGKPNGIAAGADNFMWATLQTGNAIARIPLAAPRTIKKYPIPTAGALPSGITVGADGNLWFSETGKNKIGRLADAPGHTSFVTVNDHGYSPASQGIPLASNNGKPIKVEWLFRGGASHSVTDPTAMNVVNSGPQAPGSEFTQTFPTAGTFSYGSTVGSDTMTGTIKVAPRATKAGTGKDITVTVATSVPSGVTVDIQVALPGSTVFNTVAPNVSTKTYTYTPTGPTAKGDVYKFKVRTNSNGASSDWSPAARFTF